MSTSLTEQVQNYIFGREPLKLPGNANRLALCVLCGRLAPQGGIYTCKGEDVLCPECIKRHQGLAYLMCHNCGTFMGFYKTGTVKLDAGVVVKIEPGDTLHLTWCPKCKPELGRYDIEEFRTLVLQANGMAPKDPPKEPK